MFAPTPEGDLLTEALIDHLQRREMEIEKAAYAAAAAARRLRGRKAAEENEPLRWRMATERERAEAQERADDAVKLAK